MKTRQAPGLTEAEAKAEGIPIHEDDYVCPELSEEFGENVWIHQPTGQPYFPDSRISRIFARAPILEPDDPYLEFLRSDFEM